VALTALIGPTSYVKALNTVANEDYPDGLHAGRHDHDHQRRRHAHDHVRPVISVVNHKKK
jgi:hypothetical protein